MVKTSTTLGAVLALMAMGGWLQAWPREGHTFMIPLRSRLSPVQKLNREGVEAVKRHDYHKAESLFYKAYLFDPADPFTLNNLGYISEIEGQLEPAQKFYQLAAEQGSNANIDLSNEKHLRGQPMKAATIELQDRTMRINRMNIDAMRMLQQNRNFEAIALLRQALALEPRNAFTLNNLGVANESVSDLDSALKYYQQAAATNSSEPAAITLDRSWRGKSVSHVARASATRLQKKMESTNTAEAKARMYTLRGVRAENQNNWVEARQDFLHAYALDPASAFTLNNRGYIAEREGDLETAQHFYEKSRRAGDANAKVGLATRLSAQGEAMSVVADDSDQKAGGALAVYSEQRRRQSAPVELTPRDNQSQNTGTNPSAIRNQQQTPQ